MEPGDQQESTGSYLTRRFCAIAIDGLLFTGPWLLSEHLADYWEGGLTTGEFNNLLKDLSFHTVFMLYFCLSEARWGCTVGKWSLGLRVRRSSAGKPSSFPQMLLRTAVFSGILFYLPTFVEFSTGSDLAYLIASIVAVIVLLAPTRPSNGFRGLHEIVSGTQVLQISGSAGDN
jgi:uncharacterized RDD family membrane protein YckC